MTTMTIDIDDEWFHIRTDCEMPRQGAWIESHNREVFVVVRQDTGHHTDGCLVNVINGDLKHYTSIAQPVRYTHPQAVMW